MSTRIDLHTVGGAHVHVHQLDDLGVPGATRLALRIDCREYEDRLVWVSLTPGEARDLADALVGSRA